MFQPHQHEMSVGKRSSGHKPLAILHTTLPFIHGATPQASPPHPVASRAARGHNMAQTVKLDRLDASCSTESFELGLADDRARQRIA